MAALGTTSAGALFIGATAANYEMQVVRINRDAGRLEPGSTQSFESYVGVNMQPAWSHDGSALAFLNLRDRSGRATALVIRTVATGVERELSPTLQKFNFPRWLPDAQALVVQGIDLDDRQGIFRVDAMTGAVSPVVLAPKGGVLSFPQPTPDGARLFYRRMLDSATYVIERQLSTGTERVVQQLKDFGNFALSPDGTSISIVERDATAKVFVVGVASLAGGPTREVYRAASLLGFTVTWTPDSTHLVALRPLPSKREALLIAVSGGDVKTLDLSPTVSGPVAVHPDGRRFAYQMGERLEEVWVLEHFLPEAKSPGK